MLPHMSSFCHFRRRIRRRPVPLSLTCRARVQLENLIKAARGRKLSYYRQGYRFRGSGRNSWNKKKKTRKNKVRKRNEMETCLSCICFCHVYTLEYSWTCFVYVYACISFTYLSFLCMVSRVLSMFSVFVCTSVQYDVFNTCSNLYACLCTYWILYVCMLRMRIRVKRMGRRKVEDSWGIVIHSACCGRC